VFIDAPGGRDVETRVSDRACPLHASREVLLCDGLKVCSAIAVIDCEGGAGVSTTTDGGGHVIIIASSGVAYKAILRAGFLDAVRIEAFDCLSRGVSMDKGKEEKENHEYVESKTIHFV